MQISVLKNFKKYISSYSNFPKEGIIFRDTLKILQFPQVFDELISKMSENDIIKNAEAILAIDARGFIFGTAISLKTSKPLIVARKAGKLPGNLISKEYSLEYGKDTLSIQEESLHNFESFAIVDDLIATGGTVKSVADILDSRNKLITGLVVAIELNTVKKSYKFSFPIASQIEW